ncbi:DUF3142 domain-containing protein [Gammaproteobacteria bacterium]
MWNGWRSDDSPPIDYWAWHPKVHLARVLSHAGRLYLLVGEFLRCSAGQACFQRRGFPPPSASTHSLVLVYRLEVMQWPGRFQQQIQQDIQAFEAKGNSVWGIQLDFDAATSKLGPYGALLQKVRAQLASSYGLSVTGLMDWASQGRLEDLNALQGVINEIVFQTYQGRHPVPDHLRYLESLSKRALTAPFKIGLIEHGQYDAHVLAAVRRHPYYRGTVVFLLPELGE